MTQYDNRNRGSIWKNERKTKDTDPDFTGSYTDENGLNFWVSAWKRRPDASEKAPALSFSLKPKEQKFTKPESGPQRARPSLKDEMEGDEIPF
jgi:hypothetical protein